MLCSRMVMNFILRKDVKGFHKGKDGDAGERGHPAPLLSSSKHHNLLCDHLNRKVPFESIKVFMASRRCSLICGFLKDVSSLYCHRATSATSHVVLGQFKTCVILLGGFFLFDSNPGISSICGAVTALGGMSLYTYLNLSTSHKQGAKPATSHKQSAFPPAKFGLSKGSINFRGGDSTSEAVLRS
ncbi:hypothetical protein B296_00034968 [Ensete ventricosum]|uniref:Sugar phosphate transporter domain-containing protein n=1 Tax=Ensete ventricosum TaxID=4639 RepID=A0A426YB00_ENSVE|nr:hypothetical protein B296_00034968 [Ensete ventricosum]